MARVPTIGQVTKYLRQILGDSKIKVTYFGPLGQSGARTKKESLKTLGYGVPYLVVYRTKGKERESIISTMRIGQGFGHDFRADRIDNVVLSFDTWRNLPDHVKAQDFGAFDKKNSEMISLGRSGEFFLLRQKISGVEYYRDLDRIFKEEELHELDVRRAEALAEYLAKIHSIKNEKPERMDLYARKIRDTIGHGECIMGLADSYPSDTENYLAKYELETIEKKCVSHRWKLRSRSSRLSQVHGDFHPWNILFTEKSSSFKLLDRSRGEWGEPADDVCALSMNYIFYSLRKYHELHGPFLRLYNSFIEKYIASSKDPAIYEAMPLFYTFRALVIASPLWYPSLEDKTRRKIFNFAQNVLDAGTFDPEKVNDYLSNPVAAEGPAQLGDEEDEEEQQ